MRTVTDLPDELLSAIVVETAQIWPHLLWEKTFNEFKLLEDDRDATAAPEVHYWKDYHGLREDICEYCAHSRLGFITLSHVSRAFRDKTVGIPMLWTTFNDTPHRTRWNGTMDAKSVLFWAETFTSRSLALPLEYTHHVDWYDYLNNSGSGIHEIFDRILPRIRRLHLHLGHAPKTLEIMVVLLSGAQSLESLLISRFPTPGSFILSDDVDISQFRELALVNFIPAAMQWQHDTLRNLTSLQLGFHYYRDEDPMDHTSFVELLEGLKVLHDLEALYLNNLPDTSFEESPLNDYANSLNFHKLEYLTICGQTRSVAAIVHRICAPVVRVVDMTYLHFTPDVTSSLVKLAQWVPGLAPSSTTGDIFQTTNIAFDAPHSSLTLSLSREVDARPGQYHFRITADWDVELDENPIEFDELDALEAIVHALMDAWAASQAKELLLALDECTPHYLRQFLARFISVYKLTVRVPAAHVIEAMAAQQDARENAPGLFPKLALLLVCPPSAKFKTLNGAIEEMVKARAKLGHTMEWRLCR